MAASGHRRFAALWDWMSRHEGERERQLRQEVAGKARGRTLEIGYGVGSNWPFFGAGIDYTGIEPDPYMRERAARHMPGGQALDLKDGNAEALPFEDASFDTVVGTLVFCTIADADRALAEVRRVLKPGGEFRFLEHVRARGRLGAAVQDAVTPVWSRLGGGCHPNRDTAGAMARAGFQMSELRNVKIGPLPAIVGSATPSADDSSTGRQ